MGLTSMSASTAVKFASCCVLLIFLYSCSHTPTAPKISTETQSSPSAQAGVQVAPASSPQSSQTDLQGAATSEPTLQPRKPDVMPPSALTSQWIPAAWEDLPQWQLDRLHEALPAWQASCQRVQAVWKKICETVKTLKNQDEQSLRLWMMAHLQPYRLQALDQQTQNLAKPTAPSKLEHLQTGLLTGYYEPIFLAKRIKDDQYRYPLYALPTELGNKTNTKPWYTRREIETSTHAAERAVQGREIAYLDDALDVMALQIQGSGQLDLIDASGVVTQRIRLAFAGSNQQDYKSIGVWLRENHGVRELSWPAIKAWAKANPAHEKSLLWSNPRYIFFKEMAVSNEGPKGAQGVALTAQRSIAVDPQSIPYGTPVWLYSPGERLTLARLVFAQDAGAAIKGPLRIDYYVGSGEQAGQIAGRLQQSLQLWALWPK